MRICAPAARVFVFLTLEVLPGCMKAPTESQLTRKKEFFSTIPQPSCGSNATENIFALITKCKGLHLRYLKPCIRFFNIFGLTFKVRENTPAAFFFFVCGAGMQVLMGRPEQGVHGVSRLSFVDRAVGDVFSRVPFWYALTDSVCSVLVCCGEFLPNWTYICKHRAACYASNMWQLKQAA